MSGWIANSGTAPSVWDPIFVRWPTSKMICEGMPVEGPFERPVFVKMNWALDAAMPIDAIKVAA